MIGWLYKKKMMTICNLLVDPLKRKRASTILNRERKMTISVSSSNHQITLLSRTSHPPISCQVSTVSSARQWPQQHSHHNTTITSLELLRLQPLSILRRHLKLLEEVAITVLRILRVLFRYLSLEEAGHRLIILSSNHSLIHYLYILVVWRIRILIISLNQIILTHNKMIKP